MKPKGPVMFVGIKLSLQTAMFQDVNCDRALYMVSLKNIVTHFY